MHLHRQGYLHRGQHKIFYQTFGNPQGRPWLLFHGGPGFHSVPVSNLKPFDLSRDYVILFDQRGCGRSRSKNKLQDNTTHAVVRDAVALLDKLNLLDVNVLGSSWGTTLALTLALKNPHRVRSLVLKGLFLARRSDIRHPFEPKKTWDPTRREKYDLTLKKLKTEFKLRHPFAGLSILRQGGVEAERFAKLWCAYELLISQRRWQLIDFNPEFNKLAKNIATLELHYFTNHCFLRPNYILQEAKAIKCPVTILHGAQDDVCPVEQVNALGKRLPKATIILDPLGGHGGSKLLDRQLKKVISKTK